MNYITLNFRAISRKILLVSSIFYFSLHTILYATPSFIPSLSRVYNERFIGEVAQSPELGASGTLDATFNSDERFVGSVSLMDQFSDSQAQAIVTLPNGDFLVALSPNNGGNSSKLAKYNAQGVVQSSSYGTSGVVDLQTQSQNALTMMLDMQGRALVAGGQDLDGSYGWLRRVAADGSSVSIIGGSYIVNWSFIGGLAEQSTGKIIAVGKSQAVDTLWYSTIARYNLDGTLDDTFGTAGSIIFNNISNLSNSTSGINSVVVDEQDRIYVAYLDENNHVWITRFTADGALDSTWFRAIFGVMVPSGASFITGTLHVNGPTTATFTANSTIAAYSNRLATFSVGSGSPYYVGQFTASGFSNSGNFISSSPFITSSVAVPYLDNATPSTLCMAIDNNNNLIIGAQVGNNIKVTGISIIDGSASPMDPFDSATHINGDTFVMSRLITTVDGSILITAYDATTHDFAVIKLVGPGVFPSGQLDTTFNGTGYNFFRADSGIVEGNIYDICLAPDGRIYTVSAQFYAGVNFPYVSRLYNTLYDAQVAQSPATIEQGTIDLSFGQNSTQTYKGVVSPFFGNYRGNLQQQAICVAEVAYAMQSGTLLGFRDLLIGSNGLTNTSNISSMMLTWLTPAGMLDTNFGIDASGQLLLHNETSANELFNNMVQDSSGAIYITGTSALKSATLRKYSAEGTSNWTVGTADWSVEDSSVSNIEWAGIVFQSNRLILLFEIVNSQTGQIVGFDPATGHLANGNSGAVTFGDGGSGYILYNSFGLNMGPIWSGVVNAAGIIFVAYQNTITGFVDVAAFTPDGSGLVTDFGVNGVVSNLFSPYTQINTSVTIAAANTGDLLICSADDSAIYLARLNGVTGQLDTTFNATGSTPGTNAIALTNANSWQLQGISNGSCVVVGGCTINDADAMFTMRIAADGLLDTTFNSQGQIPGFEFMQIAGLDANGDAAIATGVAIQSSIGNIGNLVISGYQQATSADATPIIIRSFGQPGTYAVKNYPIVDQFPGTLDLALNGTGYQDLTNLLATGTANVVFAYPQGSYYEGMLLVGIDNGVTTLLARINARSMMLDTTFGPDGAGMYEVSPNLQGVTCLLIDSNNNILVGGTNGSGAGAGWAQQITPDGTHAISFDLPANNIQVNTMGQQKSGRYIIAGQNIYTQNELYAFQNQLVDSNSMLQLDPTFNPLGGNTAPTGPLGCFVVGTVFGGIYTLAINSDDTILVGSQSGSGTNVQIAKITANGSGLVSGFGDSGSGIALTPIVSYIPYFMRLVIDNHDNIIVAASGNDAQDLQVIRFTQAGIVDNTWNPFGGVGQVTRIASQDIGIGIILMSLLETANQQTILLGFNESDSPDGYLFAIRLNENGVLDTTWNPYGRTPGVITFDVGSTRIMGYQSWIGISGNVWMTSYGLDPNISSTLIEIVGDADVQQVLQAPLASPAGTLDYTLDPSGALDLNTQLGSFGRPVALSILSDQSMIMAWDSMGVNITKLNPILDLDTSFNAQGDVAGRVVIPVAGLVHDLFVADAAGDDNTIYITGEDSGMWAAKISADGSTTIQLTAENSLTVGGVIRQMPNGNVLIAGYANSRGTLAAFSSDLTTLDTSFGDGGYYTTNYDTPIHAMTIDDNGLIYIAYKEDNQRELIVQRILANGSGVDESFTPTLLTRSSYPENICLELDQLHNQLIVADQYHATDDVIYVHRYSTVDGSDTGGDVTIAIDGASIKLSSLFLDTNQNIYVVGYTSSDTYTTVVARIISTSSTTIALDTANYAVDGGTPGIANVVSGPLTRSLTKVNGLAFMIAAGILDQDGRVYVAGFSGGRIPYMARFFGDNYYTQISQAVPFAPSEDGPATFDGAYGINGIETVSAGIAADAGQIVFGILPIANGTNIMTLIANADGTQSWTARQLSDGSNDATYSSGAPGNGIAISQIDTGIEVPIGIVFDGAGNSIVFGYNSVNGGFVKSILPSGAMNSGFNGITPSPIGTSYIAQFAAINAVAQLSNGNFVCVGKNNDNVGIVGILNPNGLLISSSLQNFGTNISSVSIDSQDNVYLAVGTDSNASVVKLNSAGVVVREYAASNIITNVYNTENIRLVLNAAGNIVVAASVNGDTGLVKLVGLNSDGSIDSDFNQLLIPFAANTNGVLTSLVALQNGNLLLAGYQHDFTDSDNLDFEFVASVTSSGQFDTTFNPAGTPAGLLLFQVASGEQADRNLLAMSVQYDGRILLAGGEESMSNIYTPLTMRLDGYPSVKAIQQFTGAVPVVPSVLNPAFNGTGIAFSSEIANLVDGGSTIVDSQSRVIIAGRTHLDTDNTFVVMRFLQNGMLDTSFGMNGFSQTPTLTTLVSGSYVAVDSSDNVYVGGISSDGTFFVARFLGIDGSLDIHGFNSQGTIPGVAKSYSVDSNLNHGGYVAIDYLGNVLVAGSASDSQIMVARFTPDGSIDSGYGPVVPGVTQSGVITGLFHGGSIATPQSSLLFDNDNSCYVGGVTLLGEAKTLVAVKFDSYGYLDTSFGTDGIASSANISGLVDGGPLALDTNRKIVVGGFTSNKVFVAARFLASGLFDPNFDDGIAYSSALTSLNSCLGVCIDMNDNVVLGGTSTAYDGVSMSMVIARMTPTGAIDTTLSTTGIASTGIINGLVSGGFVATNLLNNPFVGGYDGSSLVVAEIYSGAEIFIMAPQLLPPLEYKIYWFGNIPALFQNYLAIPFFADVVTDGNVKAALIEQVTNSLDQYASIYEGQANLNLLANTTPGWDGKLSQLRLLLLVLHPESTDQINEFFANFNTRRLIIHNTLAGLSSR